MRFLALIPARAGSKRLPGKNTAEINGKTLVQLALEQALLAQRFGHNVMVTSDRPDAMIPPMGSKGPFFVVERPPHLAADDTAMIDVVRHAVAQAENWKLTFDALVLLQPTSPLRTPADINAACDRLENMMGDALVSVTTARHPEVYTIGYLNRLRPITMDRELDGRPLVVPNGAIFIITKKALYEGRDWWTATTCYAYEMPASRSVDIDTADDLEQARRLWTE